MLHTSGTFSPRRRTLFIAGGGTVLGLASMILLSRVQILGVWPDVMTLYALFLTLYGNERGRYLPCMGLGLIRDVLSASPIGTYAILYGLLHKMLAPRRSWFQRDTGVVLAPLAALAVLAVNAACHAVLTITGAGIGWGSALMRCLALAAISAPLMPLMTLGMKLLLERAGVERMPGGVYNI